MEQLSTSIHYQEKATIIKTAPSKSEVIGRCGGDKKNEWPRRTDKKSNAKKNNKKNKKIALFMK